MCTRGRFPRGGDVWGSGGVAPLPHTSSCPGGSVIQHRDNIHAAMLGCLSPCNPESRLAKMRLLGALVFVVPRNGWLYFRWCLSRCVLYSLASAVCALSSGRRVSRTPKFIFALGPEMYCRSPALTYPMRSVVETPARWNEMIDRDTLCAP